MPERRICEDVGRYNPLEKLIGALATAGQDRAAGFTPSTARCFREIVEKAVRVGAPWLVPVPLPQAWRSPERSRPASA